MFVMGNFLAAVAQIVDTVITVFWWLILFRAITSWVNPDPSNTIVVFLVRVTEPVLAPFRRLVPSWNLGIDLSPLLAILALMFLRVFLVQTLYGLSYRLQ